MQVDKVTLQDLSVFHSEEFQSVFHHINLTLTNGGREYLRYLLAHPLDTVKAIEQTQLTIQLTVNFYQFLCCVFKSCS